MSETTETKTVINVSLGASFETVEEALEFVNSVKDFAKITNLNLYQHEEYAGDIPF